GTRLLATFARPANGALDGRAHFARRCSVRRTIVEGHGDVRAKHTLDCHRLFGAEKTQRAVEVRPELHAVRLDLPNLGQAEDLESAAVGQDRLWPVHELMQAAGGRDDVQTGAQVQVV